MNLKIFARLNKKLPITGKCLTAFFFVVLSSLQMEAQSTKLQMFARATDFNQNEFCDNGKGIRPEAIHAPTSSLSFHASKHNLKDARYEYVWEAKVFHGAWKAVQSGKDLATNLSFRPAALFNQANGALPMRCYWRLRARDIDNDSECAESTAFTLKLAGGHQVTCATQADINYNCNTTINLVVFGGFLSEGQSRTSEKPERKGFENHRNEGNPSGVYMKIVKSYFVEKTNSDNTETVNL